MISAACRLFQKVLMELERANSLLRPNGKSRKQTPLASAAANQVGRYNQESKDDEVILRNCISWYCRSKNSRQMQESTQCANCRGD